MSKFNETQWKAFEKQVRAYVCAKVDPLWVDDVVGGVLLRLVGNTPRLEAADNPSAYVQRVTANAVTDFYRRKSIENRTLLENKMLAEIETEAEVDDVNSSEIAISKCMYPFIKQLPDAYRVALTLTEIEQLSQKQAAEKLGLSLSGMKSRVQRGRLLLRQTVTNCCEVEFDRRGMIMDHKPLNNENGKRC